MAMKVRVCPERGCRQESTLQSAMLPNVGGGYVVKNQAVSRTPPVLWTLFPSSFLPRINAAKMPVYVVRVKHFQSFML